MTDAEKLAKHLACGVFSLGNDGPHKTDRIAFMVRCCKHGVEMSTGGLCETALASVLKGLIDEFNRKGKR